MFTLDYAIREEHHYSIVFVEGFSSNVGFY